MKFKKGSVEAKKYMAKIRAMKGKPKKKSLGATKFVEKTESKKTKPKKTIQITRKSDGTFKKFTRLAGVKKSMPKKTSVHKDTKSHNVRISVVSGVNKAPKFYDKDMAREISLFADNDADLYRQSRRPILINLSKKFKKGTFKVDLASKLWVYYIENAMKKYHKEFIKRGTWSSLLKPADRKLLAMEYAIDTLNEFNLGNFTDK